MSPKNQLQFYPNGILIQETNSTSDVYYGVEGNNWPIDNYCKNIDEKEKKYLYDYYKDNIRRSWIDEDAIDVCSNIEYINRYITACWKGNIKINILFCETNKKTPFCFADIKTDKYRFLGFDYAYSGGSYYSCVYNDIVMRNIQKLDTITPNIYGLINTEAELLKFIALRKSLDKRSVNNIFEKGNFIPYKLWRYAGELPLLLL